MGCRERRVSASARSTSGDGAVAEGESGGSRLASCGDDGAILLWDLHRGEQLQTLRRDRPYERLNITGISGVTEAQKASLRALGAIEDASAFDRASSTGLSFRS